jgi:hypothetical protein
MEHHPCIGIDISSFPRFGDDDTSIYRICSYIFTYLKILDVMGTKDFYYYETMEWLRSLQNYLFSVKEEKSSIFDLFFKVFDFQKKNRNEIEMVFLTKNKLEIDINIYLLVLVTAWNISEVECFRIKGKCVSCNSSETIRHKKFDRIFCKSCIYVELQFIEYILNIPNFNPVKYADILKFYSDKYQKLKKYKNM